MMATLSMPHTAAWCLVDPDPDAVPDTVARWLAARPDQAGLRPYAGYLTAMLAGACRDVAARRSAHRVGVLALPVAGRLYAGLLFVVAYGTPGPGPMRLDDLRPVSAEDAEVGTLVLADGRTALRVRRLGGSPVGRDGGGPVVDTADYWVPHPELPEAARVIFVTPHLVLADDLVATADELVATLTWRLV